MTALTAIKPTKAEESFRETFEALDSPGETRRASWKAYAEKGLPHKRVEEWKWSDLRGALRTAPKPGGEIRFSREPDEVGPHDGAPTQALSALAAAMAGEAQVFELTGGEALEIDVAASGALHRVIGVRVPAGGTAQVTERYKVGEGAFANIAILFQLGEGARLERTVMQDEADDGVLVVTGGVELAARAHFGQTALALGAKLARLETHLTYRGDDASARLDGAYLLNGRRHADFTTVVDHTALNCETRQMVKGAVADRGNGVFQGRFDVARGAQKTDAQMAHHALLLNEGAQANAKPELMIFADDVQCAHGNTVGALDEAALHYMRSRGLPEPAARALLIEAFIAEAFEGSSDSVREEFLDVSRRWLDKNL